MEQNEKLAYQQNQLAIERTELAKMRTELSFANSKLALERTHMAYLTTVVSLIGSGATIYKTLPMLGVSQTFTGLLTVFLFLCAIYFIYKDAITYPKMKRKFEQMQQQASDLALQTQKNIEEIEM